MILGLRDKEVTGDVLGSRADVYSNGMSLDPLASRYGISARERMKTVATGPSAQIELSRVVEVDLVKD
jgi:hypothetical protein